MVKKGGCLSAEQEILSAYVPEAVHIALLPGRVFGDYSEGHIRISYANSYENLERAVEKMKAALDTL